MCWGEGGRGCEGEWGGGVEEGGVWVFGRGREDRRGGGGGECDGRGGGRGEYCCGAGGFCGGEGESGGECGEECEWGEECGIEEGGVEVEFFVCWVDVGRESLMRAQGLK